MKESQLRQLIREELEEAATVKQGGKEYAWPPPDEWRTTGIEYRQLVGKFKSLKMQLDSVVARGSKFGDTQGAHKPTRGVTYLSAANALRKIEQIIRKEL